MGGDRELCSQYVHSNAYSLIHSPIHPSMHSVSRHMVSSFVRSPSLGNGIQWSMNRPDTYPRVIYRPGSGSVNGGRAGPTPDLLNRSLSPRGRI